MEKFFKLKEHGTDVRTEVTAGLTTFFAMSYVLFVNPSILSQAGMPTQGVFLATIIGAVVGTLMMAFYASVEGHHQCTYNSTDNCSKEHTLCRHSSL